MREGREDLTRLLLEHGVDTTVKNKDGLTALYLHDLVHRTWLRMYQPRIAIGRFDYRLCTSTLAVEYVASLAGVAFGKCSNRGIPRAS